MKKKLLTLLCAVCLLCSTMLFASCDGVEPESADQLIGEAMAKTAELDSFAATLDMDMKMTFAGETQKIFTVADMKVKDAQSDNPVMSTDVSMSVLGEGMLENSMEMSMYLADGWLYMDMGELGKIKAKQGSYLVADYDYNDDLDDMMVDIPDEVLEELEIKTASDGSKTVTITLDDETFSELYKDMLSEMKNSFDSLGNVDHDTIRFSDAVISITVQDGYLWKYAMSFEISVAVGDGTAVTEVEVMVTYNDPGKDVKVTEPDDLDSYVAAGT